MQRGIGRLRARTSGDADVQAWQAAVIANGGTVSAGTLAAVATYTSALKAAGLWTKIKRNNRFCGDQLAAALVPLIVGTGNPTDTNMNFVGGDYSESAGMTGNGSTKYLKTGLILSTLSQNSAHMAFYNKGLVLGSKAEMGTSGNFLEAFSDGKIYSTIGSTLISGVLTPPYAFEMISRTGANAQAQYQRGVSVASDAGASSALSGVEVYIHATNNAGTAISFSTAPLAGYSIGDGLTAGEAATYNTIEQAFQTALGRNV